jgi:cytochrome c-type biogenesis protein CcmH
MKRLLRAFLLALSLLAAAPAYAVLPDEMLSDPVLEARARDLSAGLRCLVCRNQSIDDSNAELARDLRLLIRERLVAGDSDEEAVAYLVGRYGNFILLKPPVQANTILLWLGPLLLLIFAVWGFRLLWRRGRGALNDDEFSQEDRALIENALGKDEAAT